MTQHFYRFRPIKALLDGYHELEKQEIYFASPSELNDPQEGVRDTFWLGDRVVWRNLHRHYLKCLTRAMQVWTATAGEHELDWSIVPLFDPWLTDSVTPALKELVDRIESEFFSPEPSFSVVSVHLCVCARNALSLLVRNSLSFIPDSD